MNAITIGTLFFEGLLSFFSPCILPVLPVYIGYLTADAKEEDSDGKIIYKRKKVILITIFFVLGISSTFFIAGLSMISLKEKLSSMSHIFSLLSGVMLILFALVQWKVIVINAFNKEYRFNLPALDKAGPYIKALLFGFFFSFSWTPCIGPMLSSAIVVAANASSSTIGMMYLLAYTLGFIIPFMMLGLFTEEALMLFKKNNHVVQWTIKLSGIILFGLGSSLIYNAAKEMRQVDKPVETSTVTSEVAIEKYNFTLIDQFGAMHTLSNYRGKVIIVSFFATWCPYCEKELPSLIEISKTMDDVQVLLIGYPNGGREVSEEKMKEYITKNGYNELSFLFDRTGEVFKIYGASGLPMTYIYKPDGEILGYLGGYTSLDDFKTVIERARTE